MSATYYNFLERLKEERMRLGLSQSDIGQILRMSQSHYSKAELGTRRFTYYETQCLCETEADVYYIFSGERCKIDVNNFFQKCTFEELVCYLDIICVVIMRLHNNKSLALSRDTKKKIENIKYVVMSYEKNKTIFYKLRRILDHNQMEMANLLGVDVKKLRGMESGKILPDSEIIWRLSEEFYIPYALLLGDKKGLVYENYYLLNLIKENKRKDILNSIMKLFE